MLLARESSHHHNQDFTLVLVESFGSVTFDVTFACLNEHGLDAVADGMHLTGVSMGFDFIGHELGGTVGVTDMVKEQFPKQFIKPMVYKGNFVHPDIGGQALGL